MSQTIRLLIADDHPVVRDGLRGIFEASGEFEVAGEAANGREAVDRAAALQPDVVLMDLRMPVLDGVSAIKMLAEKGIGARVLVLTTFDTDTDVVPAIEAGATGYLLKDSPPDELLRGVRAAARGEAVLSPSVATRLLGQVRQPAREPLSQRELDILGLIAQGCSNREAAARLFISEATVKTHVLHIYAKLGVNDRAAAVATGFERGLLPALTTVNVEAGSRSWCTGRAGSPGPPARGPGAAAGARSQPGAGHDAVGAGAGHQRADGQAQLVQQASLDQLSQQVRAALGEHPAVAAFGQRVHRGREIDGVLARDDDLRVPGQLVPPGGRGAGRGDDDRAGVRRGRGDQRAVRVEIEPPGDHRDRRRRRPPVPQVTPQLLWPGRLVLLLADRGRADQDDVAQRAEQREHPPVGIGGDALRDAVQRRGAVRRRDHVRPQPAAVRVSVEPGQIRFPVEEKLAQAHSVDRSTTTAWSRTSISFFGGWIAPGTPDAVSMTTSQPAA